MKILENPNPIPSEIHVCKGCGCKFEYTDRDIVKESGSDANGRIGGTHYYWYYESVTCPNCGEVYIIKQDSGYANSCIKCPVSEEITEYLNKELCTQ